MFNVYIYRYMCVRANTRIIAHLLFNLKAFVVFAADVYTRTVWNFQPVYHYINARARARRQTINPPIEEYRRKFSPGKPMDIHMTVFKRLCLHSAYGLTRAYTHTRKHAHTHIYVYRWWKVYTHNRGWFSAVVCMRILRHVHTFAHARVYVNNARACVCLERRENVSKKLNLITAEFRGLLVLAKLVQTACWDHK